MFKISLYGSGIMFLATIAFLLGYSSRSDLFALNQSYPSNTQKITAAIERAQETPSLTPTPMSGTVYFYELIDNRIEQFDAFTHDGSFNEVVTDNNGLIYFSDGSSLNSYNFNSKQLSKLADFPGEEIVSVNKSVDDGNLWFSTTLLDWQRFLLHEYDVHAKSLVNIDMVFDPVHYGSVSRVDDKTDTLIVMNAGGDGCGGYGKIIAMRNNLLSELYEFGSGCIDKPRLVVYSQSLDLAMFAKIDNTTLMTEEERVTGLVFFNPFTKSIVAEKDVTNGPFISPYAKVLSHDQEKVGLFSADKFYILDLNTKEFVSEIPLTARFIERPKLSGYGSGVWSEDDRIYFGFDDTPKSPGLLGIIDTKTSEVIEIEGRNEKYNNQTYAPIGFVNGRMIFYFKRPGISL